MTFKMTLNRLIDFSEMYKLVAFCSLENIPFTFTRFYDGYKIDVGFDDAIIHTYSNGHKVGLLECFKFEKCKGYQTADEIIAEWKKHK